MAVAVNILAHLAPGPAVETLLYSPPKDNKALLAELVVCNRSPAPGRFRVSVSLLGVATATKDFLYYDCPIAGNDTVAAELDLTLNAFDAFRIYDTNGTLTFTLFGNPS